MTLPPRWFYYAIGNKSLVFRKSLLKSRCGLMPGFQEAKFRFRHGSGTGLCNKITTLLSAFLLRNPSQKTWIETCGLLYF